MTQFSKKRGVDYNAKEKLSLDEKRRQWNADIARRQLEHMFGSIECGEVNIVNSKRKSVSYTPETLYQKAFEYFENIIESNENNTTIIPDTEDFCTFARISRPTFMKYRRSEDPEMAEVANNIATAIASCKKQNAYAGLINPIAFAMDMNNNHDYVQSKTETTINSNISLKQVEANINEIANRIPMEDIPMLEEKNIIDERGN
jgi:hypothetical protein